MKIEDLPLCKETFEMTAEELAAYVKAQADAKRALDEIFAIIKKETEVMEEFKNNFKVTSSSDKEIVKAIDESLQLTKSAFDSFKQNYIQEFYAELGEPLYANIFISQDWIDKCEVATKMSNKKEAEKLQRLLKTADGKSDMRFEVRRLVPQTLVNTNTNRAIQRLEKMARNEAKKSAARKAAPKGTICAKTSNEPKVLSYAQKVDFVRLTLTQCHKNYLDGTGVAFDMRRKGNETGFKTMWNKLRDLNDKVIDKPWAREMVVEDKYGLPVYDENGLVKLKPTAVTEENLATAEKDIAKASKIIRVVETELGK